MPAPPLRASALLAALLGLVGLHAEPARANLIVNGSFELPDVGPTGVMVIFSGGEPPGFGWTVGIGNVEVAGEQYPPLPGPSFDGGQHLDLNGVTVGQIFQVFATTAGADYTLTYAYASNYAHHDEADPARAMVYVTDIVSNMHVVTPTLISHGTSSETDLDWFVHEVTFTAVGESTGLSFDSESRQTPLGGMLLDGISVVVPEPATAALCLVGLAGLAARRRP